MENVALYIFSLFETSKIHVCLIPQEDELKKAILVVFANKQVNLLCICN